MTIAKWKEDTPTDPRKYMSTTCVTHEHEHLLTKHIGDSEPAHKGNFGLAGRTVFTLLARVARTVQWRMLLEPPKRPRRFERDRVWCCSTWRRRGKPGLSARKRSGSLLRSCRNACPTCTQRSYRCISFLLGPMRPGVMLGSCSTPDLEGI